MRESYHCVGFIVRKHGVAGHVKVLWDAPLTEKPKIVYIKNEGQFVPFFIQSMSGSNTSPILQLEDIDSHEKARHLLQKNVYIEKNNNATTTSSATDLKDYHVICQNKNVGIIVNTDESIPQNPLLIVALNQKKKIFIPLQEDFIDTIDTDKKNIKMNLPDGLIDMQR